MTTRKTSGGKANRKTRASSTSGRQEKPSRADLQTLAALIALAHDSRPKKRVKPGTRLALSFSEDERKLILDTWSIADGLTEEQLKAFEKARKPVLRLTLADWDELAGWVAATANHARSGSRLKRRADALFDQIHALLDRYTDD